MYWLIFHNFEAAKMISWILNFEQMRSSESKKNGEIATGRFNRKADVL